MLLLFEKFIGFFLWIACKRSAWTIYSLLCQHHKNNTDIYLLCVCVYGLSVVVAERQSHRDLSPLFSRGILFIHGGFHNRCQVKSDQQGLYWLFYVFTLTEINNSHNIVGRVLMSWLTSMFSSFFSLTYKKSKLAASSSDFEGCENLTSPAFANRTFWRLVCQSISCPSFWDKRTK